MKYGFLGSGNMGGAIARALSSVTKDILLADKLTEKALSLAEELGVSAGGNEQAVETCERVFLAVKPQMLPDMMAGLRTLFQEKKPLIITMAAGQTMEKIDAMAGGGLPIIRIMPNTPVAVGKGMILYCRNALVSDELLSDVLRDMEACGVLDELPEKLIDAGSAVSGCGPAFLYMLMEALADGGVACGLPRDKALLYAEMTMAGAAELALTSPKHPEQLKDEVCSPGGSTIQGTRVLERQGFRSAAMEAVLAAWEKTAELGKQ